MMIGRIGRYNGVDYRLQRICDVLVVDSTARWYFAYFDGKPTGDHFRTLKDFECAVNSGHFAEVWL